jgi:hypothetical protein
MIRDTRIGAIQIPGHGAGGQASILQFQWLRCQAAVHPSV